MRSFGNYFFALVLVTATLTSLPTGVAFADSPNAGGDTSLYGALGNIPGGTRGSLITIDQETAAGTIVGPGVSPAAGITGLAFDISGTLYASTIPFPFAPTTLVILDPIDGTVEDSIGVIHLSNETPLTITDLAVQPGTDVLFGTALSPDDTNNIYTIDKETAEATLVGNTGVLGASIAFAPDGTLYMSSAELDFSQPGPPVFIRGFLHTIDPETAAVLTTSDPYTDFHVGGLTVRPTDGTIFVSGGFPGEIATISPDGDVDLIGTTGVGGVGDIAFTPLPLKRGDCKNGGWALFSFPYSFKNQGNCIQLVNTGQYRPRDNGS